MAKAANLPDLLLNKLMALYDVETQILKAVPTVIKKAKDTDLKKALQHHVEETKEHASRLQQSLELLGTRPKKLKREAIRGLLEDTKWVISHVTPGPALDANLIAATQYIKQYEIAGYTSAIAWAKLMGYTVIEKMLSQTLKEEESGSQALKQLAETKINDKVTMRKEKY